MRLKSVILSTLGLALLLSPLPAAAKIWSPGTRKIDEPLASILAKIRQDKVNIFYSDCSLGDEVKAVMIFRAGSLEGDFFTLGYRPNRNDLQVPGRGRVSIKDGTVSVLSYDGLTKQLLPKLSLSLMVRKFSFLVGGKNPNEIVTNWPEFICTGEFNARP